MWRISGEVSSDIKKKARTGETGAGDAETWGTEEPGTGGGKDQSGECLGNEY